MSDPLQLARDALSAMLKYATGDKQGHLYEGDCPDQSQPASRDASCPACKQMVAASAVLAALDAAIAQRGEPVAWRDPANTDPAQSVTFFRDVHEAWPHIYSQPLYTAPPARVPLTDEQVLAVLASITNEPPVRLPPGWASFARAIERAHGITGA